MIKVAMLALGASLTMGAIAPQNAAAQLSGRERSEQARRDRGVIVEGRSDTRVDGRSDGRCFDDDRFDRRDDDRKGKKGKGHKNKDRNDVRRVNSDRWDRDCDDVNVGRSNRKGNGPPFCRNGQGHPVHGRAWCREKGWDDSSLRNTRWEDVILRRPRDVAQRDLGRSVLQDILGGVVLGRFDQQRRSLGVSAPLVGRWADTSNGSLLNLYAGGIQIGQLLDRNRDGRADVVLMNYGDR